MSAEQACLWSCSILGQQQYFESITEDSVVRREKQTEWYFLQKYDVEDVTEVIFKACGRCEMNEMWGGGAEWPWCGAEVWGSCSLPVSGVSHCYTALIVPLLGLLSGYCTALYYTILYCCCTVLYCTVSSSLSCVLYSTPLYSTLFHWTVLCTLLQWPVFCSLLHCTVLSILLHCTVFFTLPYYTEFCTQLN